MSSSHSHTKEIEEELRHFQEERERIKQMLGSIGGTNDIRKHKIFNWIILAVTVGLFTLEITTHIIPTMLSLEVGLLLISLKIIMLIQSMLRQNHFEFWMLNTIEYRINEVSRKVALLEKRVAAGYEAGHKEKKESALESKKI